MTWVLVGFAFGIGAIAAVVVAGLAVIILGAVAVSREGQRKTQEALEEYQGWEGTA